MSSAAKAINGTVVGDDVDFEGATQDSRFVRDGMLFVPIVAERDGHEFIHAALASGAAAYLTAKEPVGGVAIQIDDPAEALQQLGSASRDRLEPAAVIGVTGSVGKTTTKDLLASVLSTTLVTHANEKSFNNDLGVPLTLVNAPDDTQAAVIEMGARGEGHIRRLCAVARPTIGVVTTVGPAHVGEFGSVEAVAAAKSELVQGLMPTGVAVLNATIPLVAAMASVTEARVIRFGDGGDVVAERVTVDSELFPAFRLQSPWGSIEVQLGVRGEHLVENALAAATVGLYLGVSLDNVAGGLAQPQISPMRMEMIRTASGAVVLNDTYNANPQSVAAALRALAAVPAQRRVAVLGVMAELGDHSADAHGEMGELARTLGIDVISVGAPGYGGVAVESIEDAMLALASIAGPIGEGDAVLAKGSRVAGLERLVALLALT